MKKPISVRLICLICLAGLALGCAPGASKPAPIQEKVTLILTLPQEYQNFYDPALVKFKELEPNITVETRLQYYDNQQGDVILLRWYQLGQSDAAGNSQPLDLTPLLQEDKTFNPTDYFPGALDSFKGEGKQLGLPVGLDPDVIFYNKDLFDRLGVAYPQPGWTWEQFRTTAMQLTDVPTGFFGYKPSERYFDSLYFVYQNGGSFYDDQQKVKLNGPETVKAVEWYTSLFGPDGPAATQSQMQKAYGLGGGDTGIVTSKIGMWMDSLSNLTTTYSGMIKFKVGIAALPHGEKAVSLAPFDGLMIRSGTQNPQAAWRLVEFLAQQPNTLAYPARKSLADSAVFLSGYGKDKASEVRQVIENTTSYTTLDYRTADSTLMSFTYAVQISIEQGVPAADALQSAQDSSQP